MASLRKKSSRDLPPLAGRTTIPLLWSGRPNLCGGWHSPDAFPVRSGGARDYCNYKHHDRNATDGRAGHVSVRQQCI